MLNYPKTAKAILKILRFQCISLRCVILFLQENEKVGEISDKTQSK